MTESLRPPSGAPLGLYGGTFDPVHLGHLRLAEEAVDALGLAGVRWIPAGQPLLREAPRVAARQRLDMVRLATAGNPRFTVDPAEVEADRPSYTVPTLERLRRPDELGSERPLVLLLGADAFAGVSAWHRWEALFELAHVAVAHRPGYLLEAAALPPPLARVLEQRRSLDPADLRAVPAGRIVSFAMTPLDISATRIRAALSKGESVRYLLPDALIGYLQTHRLYTE